MSSKKQLLIYVVLLILAACSKPSGDAYIGKWRFARGCEADRCNAAPKPNNSAEEVALTTEVTRNGEVFVVTLSSVVVETGLQRPPSKLATRRSDGSLYVELKDLDKGYMFSIINNEKTDSLEIRFVDPPKGTSAENLVFHFARN